MKFKTREEHDADPVVKSVGDFTALRTRMAVILGIAKEAQHGSVFSRSGFKWMLPEMIYYCEDLIKLLEEKKEAPNDVSSKN